MNKPQAEGRVNHICTVERRRISSTLFSNKKNNEAQLLVYLNHFCLLVWLNWVIKGQQQRHWLIKWD